MRPSRWLLSPSFRQLSEKSLNSEFDTEHVTSTLIQLINSLENSYPQGIEQELHGLQDMEKLQQLVELSTKQSEAK